jgi:hypothetical protein
MTTCRPMVHLHLYIFASFTSAAAASSASVLSIQSLVSSNRLLSFRIMFIPARHWRRRRRWILDGRIAETTKATTS